MKNTTDSEVIIATKESHGIISSSGGSDTPWDDMLPPKSLYGIEYFDSDEDAPYELDDISSINNTDAIICHGQSDHTDTAHASNQETVDFTNTFQASIAENCGCFDDNSAAHSKSRKRSSQPSPQLEGRGDHAKVWKKSASPSSDDIQAAYHYVSKEKDFRDSETHMSTQKVKYMYIVL